MVDKRGDWMKRGAARVLLAGLLVLAGESLAQADFGGSVEVVDGDTLRVDGRDVDLDGIDAPEIGQTCGLKGRTIRCGVIARTALMDLTAGARVTCRVRGDASAVPVVARCEVDGFDLSQNMVHTGWALADRRRSARYAAIEDKARAAGRGLWRAEFVPPWEWRRERETKERGAPAE